MSQGNRVSLIIMENAALELEIVKLQQMFSQIRVIEVAPSALFFYRFVVT